MRYWIDDMKEVADVPKSRQAFFPKCRSKLSDMEYTAIFDYINDLAP